MTAVDLLLRLFLFLTLSWIAYVACVCAAEAHRAGRERVWQGRSWTRDDA